VTSGPGVVAFQLIEIPGSGTVVGLNAQIENPLEKGYSAQLANGSPFKESGFFTNLSIINTTLEKRNVALDAIAEDGNPMAPQKQLSLLAGEHFEGDLGELFELGSNQGKNLKVGSLKIQFSGPGIIGDVLFGEPATLRYAAALPLQNSGFTRAVFSQVANALGYFTGLAFFNPNAGACKVTISVYSADGKLTGRRVITILPGHRRSDLLAFLIESTAGQIGGHIVVESTRPIIAQQLFGDSVLNFLSAVPPVDFN